MTLNIHESIIKKIAEDERVSWESIKEGLEQGHIVIPMNKNRRLLKPCAVGKGLRTKVNANIGTSQDTADLSIELEKLKAAVGAGADAVMDLSTGGDIDTVRREILSQCPVPLGTVPIYQAAIEAVQKKKSLVEMTPDEIFSVIERQARDGVDFLTVHCGITSDSVKRLKQEGRVASVVSRGGAFTIEWMTYNKAENPLYQYYDRLLDICKEHNVTLSLGDGFRPGCLADATDRAQIQELITWGELVDRARAAGVQAMVEGPGHVPIDQIEANVKIQKELCQGAPFYVLGPLVTDIALGYDHITAAIGGAWAAYFGADFLCYVTPSEHLKLPDVDDVREGVIVLRIAAHAADIAKGVPGAREWDLKMSQARKALDWEKQIELSINPPHARQVYESAPKRESGACTMCGDYCSMKKMNEVEKT
ncbi:phosphomethylpyrimidine synthase ThiC [candidate division TA06 bacterium]|uniref:Phosphomethylpyrimidine synthase n=1 Tax=candidate division TA06 bacterium TaxID=2250710 RepID=A0A933I8B8_UNCT6|nr:phosphomethylpyrimidine synthase ThiC [candidate division TA06 bacterium]